MKIQEQISENLGRCSRGFSSAQEFSQTFYKIIIFQFNKVNMIHMVLSLLLELVLSLELVVS